MRTSKNCQGGELVLPCSEVYRYPTKFREFHWWNSPDKLVANARDEIPIPALTNEYPYRYSSAAPCSVGRTQKELDMYRCFLDSKPKVKRSEVYDIRDIVQIDGYETTTMTASVVPFRAKRAVTDFHSNKIPTGLNEPLFAPYKGHSPFEEFVIDSLYLGWKKDPLYKRRVIFRMDFFKPPLT